MPVAGATLPANSNCSNSPGVIQSCEVDKRRHYFLREADPRIAETVATTENQRLKIFSAVTVSPKHFD
jgi:hypothetical protein